MAAAEIALLAKRYIFEGTEHECTIEVMPYGRVTLQQDDDVIILPDLDDLYKAIYDLNRIAIEARRASKRKDY